jgi:tetratricopeptide (TPR) repeat protein
MSNKQDSKSGETILARIGDHVHNVVVGKNIIQIGQLSIPRWLVLLFSIGILLSVILLVFNVYQGIRTEDNQRQFTVLLTPTSTPIATATPIPTPTPGMSGSFNIFVADFGELDDSGYVQRSQYSHILSLSVFETLNRIYADLEKDTLTRLEIWHDSLGFTKIGPIQGRTPEDREVFADQIARSIGADMVIYGHLAPMGNEDILMLEFYFHSKRIWTTPDVVAGGYPLGQPIPVPIAFRQDASLAKRLVEEPLRLRSQALFWMTMGLSYSVIDRTEQSVAIFRQVEDKVKDWQDSEGKWILYYLWGREETTLRNYDVAIQLFERAIAANPDFINAYVGLGSVYYDRAQLFFVQGQQLPEALAKCRLAQNIDQGAASMVDALTDIERSILLYHDALSRIPEPSAAEMNAMVQQALGLSYRLQGQAQITIAYHEQVAGEPFVPTLVSGEQLLTAAKQELIQTLEPSKQNQQYSLLALSHWAIGSADRFLAHIRLIEVANAQTEEAADLAASKRIEALTLLEAALDHYAICSSQQTNIPTDLLLKTRIIDCACNPSATEVQSVLSKERAITRVGETSE